MMRGGARDGESEVPSTGDAHWQEGRPANPAYARFHRPRFTFLIDVLRPYVRRPGVRILDVGPSPLTPLMSRELRLPVESLGLEPEESDPKEARHRHHSFDLNDAQYRERWRTNLGPYDIVVFAEVVEHLYTAPDLVLAYLRQLLAPGGILLLQTPNAAALRKRVKLALGLNPFERIRLDRSNPGHFREYTLAELLDMLTRAGFTVERTWMKYYFDAAYERHERGDEQPSKIKGGLKNFLYGLLPPSLQEGITIVAKAPET
jgi:2-polyprenyl-3-methyl-5-hydroxy-6-metoxy-1,4-benzoquinol methylase